MRTRLVSANRFRAQANVNLVMLAAGADVPYVQAQVGHTDPKVTLEIYALVVKRRNRRQFADAFDDLMRDALPSM